MDAKTEGVFEERVKKFRRAKWIALAVFLVFLAFGLIAFRSEITLENLRYLFKYVNFSGASGFAAEGTEIRYDADSGNRFAVYRGDLVVANNGGVSLFDPSGNLTMSDPFSMSNPVIVTDGKYLVVYDLGGYYLKIYNSFSILHEQSFDYRIQSAATNVNGYVCVATSEKSYHSALYVYNDDFQQVYKWLSSDKFITDCAISSANEITLSTLRAENGDLVCELTGLSIGKGEADFAFSAREELPIEILPYRYGSLYLSDRALRLIREGEIVSGIPFDEDSIDLFVLGEEISAVAQNELLVGVNYKLRLFDRELTEIGSMNFSSQILDMKISGDTLFVLTRGRLYRFRGGEVAGEYEFEGDYVSFELFSANNVVLCSDQSASVLIVN